MFTKNWWYLVLLNFSIERRFLRLDKYRAIDYNACGESDILMLIVLITIYTFFVS